MHKLAKGLKKKKKQKKGKKGAEEDEFDPEELERYRRERAEAQQKAGESGEAGGAGSDEWRKFEALTAGVDSILKKTQGDLDRIKSTSFFQRKAPLEEAKKPQEETEAEKESKKRWVGFDKEGNPVEEEPGKGADEKKEDGREGKGVEAGFVEVPSEDEEQDDSADEDVFDTAYVEVLQSIDVQLAYVPDSPTQEEAGDDPFDTTSADKVLKTVDKKGNKLVSLGNAVEVLSGRIDHVSTCKLGASRRPRTQDLLLGDFEENGQAELGATIPDEVPEVEKTLLDDDSDLPDVPVDLTKLPPILDLPKPVQEGQDAKKEISLDLAEFDELRTKESAQEEDELFDLDTDLEIALNEVVPLREEEDPFAEKDAQAEFQTEIIEAVFEAATFADEEDPFDTTIADNLLPGKTELKFIEKELEELPVSEVSISLTDPAGLNRDYETGLLKLQHNGDLGAGFLGSGLQAKKDLLGGSTTDLTQLADEPIKPIEEEISYVDPFDTSNIKEPPPGRGELKFLEKEILGEAPSKIDLDDDDDDDDFDPRKEEIYSTRPAPPRPAPPFQVNFDETEEEEDPGARRQDRKLSRPEALEIAPTKVVAFELPTPSQRPDLLATSEEEKAIPSKPLTPYYSQKSLEECLPEEDVEEEPVDPFDTSFVANVTPGKTELKLIESELLAQQEVRLPHSVSDQDLEARSQEVDFGRRRSDFAAGSVRPRDLKFELASSLVRASAVVPIAEEPVKEVFRQESLLDAEFQVDAKPLTPKIETRTIEEEVLSYADPFDTSIATNLPPGKAELKLLENELGQIPEQPPAAPISLVQATVLGVSLEDDFDPRAEEIREVKDFLTSEDQDPGTKALTPLNNSSNFIEDEEIDPFDTSFAAIGPGKTELKLLESELIEK